MPDISQSLSPTDRALIQAALAWGSSDSERLFNRFPGAWRERLRTGWADQLAQGQDAASALAALKADAASEARLSHAHVHETWWLRALQEESPAVQQTILLSAPEPVRQALLASPDTPSSPTPPPHPAHPQAVQVALSLWAERLVGGPATLDSEPEIIRLVSGDAKTLSRRLARLALAKWSYVLACGGPPLKAESKANLSDSQKARIERYQTLWTDPDSRAGQLGRLDIDHHVTGKPQDLQSLGLVSVARLLASADPHRTRWALQHIPYNLAKFLRSRMGLKTPFIAGDELVSWEQSLFLATADPASGDDHADSDGEGDDA